MSDSPQFQSGAGPSSEWIAPDASRLEALAEFAAGAGHEINNPLATIIGRAQQLLKDEANPQRRQMLLAIGAQAYRIRDMIGDAMLFGRPPRPELQTVNLAEVSSRVIERQKEMLTASRCNMDREIPATIQLQADPVQLSIVLSELIRNSVQALQPGGGTIQIRAAVNDDFAQIEVEDHGQGFSEHERIHAFDPFFSGRQAGRGLGFGLPKCWQIVRQHHGTIDIQSQPRDPTTEHPTIVRIKWPLAALPHERGLTPSRCG